MEEQQKSFIVRVNDLEDKNKNPNLSLSVKDILKNKKIKKLKTHFRGYRLGINNKMINQEMKGGIR